MLHSITKTNKYENYVGNDRLRERELVNHRSGVCFYDETHSVRVY